MFTLLLAIRFPADAQNNTAPLGAHSEPSLVETEKWLQHTLTDPMNSWTDSHCLEPSSQCWYVRYGVNFDGCKVVLTSRYYTGMGELVKDSEVVISFNFADIDPYTVKADHNDMRLGIGSYVTVRFRTTDDGNKIKIEYSGDPSSSGKAEVLHECCGTLDDGITVTPDYSPRLVNALTHAVRLCGGKRSTF